MGLSHHTVDALCHPSKRQVGTILDYLGARDLEATSTIRLISCLVVGHTPKARDVNRAIHGELVHTRSPVRGRLHSLGCLVVFHATTLSLQVFLGNRLSLSILRLCNVSFLLLWCQLVILSFCDDILARTFLRSEILESFLSCFSFDVSRQLLPEILVELLLQSFPVGQRDDLSIFGLVSFSVVLGRS